MARQVLGIQAFENWAEFHSLYGPQPNLEDQVYGKPLDPEPIGLVRTKTDVDHVVNVPPVAWRDGDEAVFLAQVGFANSGQYFIVPFRLGLILTESQASENTGSSVVGTLYGVCRARILSKDNALTPGYFAHSPQQSDNERYTTVWETQTVALHCQYFDFGFPRPGAWDWMGYNDMSGSPLIEFQWTIDGSPSGPRKQISLTPVFEALCFDKRQVDHSAFVRDFLYRGDGRFSVAEVNVAS